MLSEIERTLDVLERGGMTRRQAVARLGAVVTALVGAERVARAVESEEPTFPTVGLNHVALRVTDVPRSRDFYVKHLGLSERGNCDERSCFLNCGPDFVALFRGEKAEMDHYCYSVRGYDIEAIIEKLRKHDLEYHRESNRIYFEDPDGLTVQLAEANH